jgi:hypothetical protein
MHTGQPSKDISLLNLISESNVCQLADFANLTQPWTIDVKYIPEGATMKGFKNSKGIVPADVKVLEQEYCRLMGQSYPIKELSYVRSWMMFRVSS